jgi:hypothetical protein
MDKSFVLRGGARFGKSDEGWYEALYDISIYP